MKRIRVWDILLGAALFAALVHMAMLLRQRAILIDAIDGATGERPELATGDERVERLGDVRAERDRLAAKCEKLQADLDALGASSSSLKSDLALRNAESSTLALRVATLEARASGKNVEDMSLAALRNELLATIDRLEKAYKDIAEMEQQLVELARANNDLTEKLGGSQHGETLGVEPKIDGVVLGTSDKVNLVLISAGAKDKVQVGFKFTVYRGSEYVSKLVVDKVEDGWAACRELTDFRKSEIQQGDNVTTRVYD